MKRPLPGKEALILYLSDKIESGASLPDATDYERIDADSDAIVRYVSTVPVCNENGV